MNIKKVKELVEIMRDNDLTEVEVEQEGMKIKLSKKVYGGMQEGIAQFGPVRAAAPTASQEAATAAQEKQSNLKEVKSPMVGTFYKSPSPDSDPYVSVGDVVKKGDVICIIEAMKLMNEVKAEFGGKIVEICVENADAIEFGQVLFKME